MLLISESDGGLHPAAEPRAVGMRDGLVGSLALHLVAILLAVFGLPWLVQAPPPEEQVVPVSLVELAENTAAPSTAAVAPLPQEKAREAAPEAATQAVPAPQTPPAAAEHPAKEPSRPALSTAIEPAQKPTLPRPAKAPKPASRSAAKLPQPSPEDELSARLKALARLRQPAPPVPAEPRHQDGAGASNLSATSAAAARARDPAYGVKDMIRAQVIRRWNLHRDAAKHADWTVAIHIVLNPDGKVVRAEIVDDPRYRSDSAYRDFALSARNAVLMSSPIAVPAEAYEIAKDIVVDFDPKTVSQ